MKLGTIIIAGAALLLALGTAAAFAENQATANPGVTATPAQQSSGPLAEEECEKLKKEIEQDWEEYMEIERELWQMQQLQHRTLNQEFTDAQLMSFIQLLEKDLLLATGCIGELASGYGAYYCILDVLGVAAGDLVSLLFNAIKFRTSHLMQRRDEVQARLKARQEFAEEQQQRYEVCKDVVYGSPVGL